jgi:putative glycosyltransferase (TIGR04372 family)
MKKSKFTEQRIAFAIPPVQRFPKRRNPTDQLSRYVTKIRRATYAAEQKKTHARVRAFYLDLLESIYRWMQRVLLRPLKRIDRPVTRHLRRRFAHYYSRVRNFYSRFGRRLLRPLERRWNGLKLSGYYLIKWLVGYLFASGRNSRSFSPRTITLSYWLIEQRIPVVSPITRHLVHANLVTLLGTHIIAGNIDNMLSLARILNLAFRPFIRARQMPSTLLYFQALLSAQRYDRIVAEVPEMEDLRHHFLNHIAGVAYLYSNRPAVAVRFLQRAMLFNDQHAEDHRILGCAYLRLGDEAQASLMFRAAVNLAPKKAMAHGNYAARYDTSTYRPKNWEIDQAEQLLIYDNYTRLAEDVFLLGRFEESFQLYQKALVYQKRISAPLPKNLLRRLMDLDSRIDPSKPIRLLSYEWVTQFGHIGLLDSYIKMATVGIHPQANRILLAPDNKVSNKAYLGYWHPYFTIVRDGDLVDELFPFQRSIGDNFMAVIGPEDVAEPWTRAAARAQIAWARLGNGPLLKVSDEHVALGTKALQALGVPNGAWYVGLHVREAGYYGESSGGISVHRNAGIEDYLPAIRTITKQGGYIIRLGDSSMRPLPKMDRVVDYAHSKVKSEAVDIFLCATSRFVIGTTSGLTTACLSFGTPMILVNCISNDWQLWSAETDFITKLVWDRRAKRHLTLAELYSHPIQGFLVNAATMCRHGIESIPNNASDIEAAVRYKLDLMNGLTNRPVDTEEPMRSYRVALAHNPMVFGAAYPVPQFLDRHRIRLL